jgi:hypothetical protein
MSRFQKSSISLAAAVVLLALAGRSAAHAMAVVLVQIMNTAATPAITQDVSKLATQNVELNCSATCFAVSNQGTPGATYTVPSNQRLVIVTVQFTTTTAGNVILSQTNQGVNEGNRIVWPVVAEGTYQYQYPSGIVFASGTTDIVLAGQAISNGYMFGYLTSN